MTKVLTKFIEHQIVPDIVEQAPKRLLQVTYENDVVVLLGKELTPTQVKNMPISLYWETDPNFLYTLIMIDPDVPTRENHKLREILHWLVVNISGNNISTGDTLTTYIGSGAHEGTGLHRLTLLVYRQAGRIEETDVTTETTGTFKSRPQWKTERFAKKHRLGNPLAGNFFMAQYDEYVPILQAKLIKAGFFPSSPTPPPRQFVSTSKDAPNRANGGHSPTPEGKIDANKKIILDEDESTAVAE